MSDPEKSAPMGKMERIHRSRYEFISSCHPAKAIFPPDILTLISISLAPSTSVVVRCNTRVEMACVVSPVPKAGPAAQAKSSTNREDQVPSGEKDGEGKVE